MRVEHITLKDGNIATNVQAFFLESQDPNKLPGLMFNTCSLIQSYESTVNPSDSTFNSRVWRDLGESVTLSDGSGEIVLQRETDMEDKSGRVHDVIYVKNQAASGGVTGSELTLGAQYEAVSDDLGTIVVEPLRLPGDFTTTGGLTIPGANTLDGSADVTWDYTSPTEAETGIAFVAFAGANTNGDSETWFCPTEKTGSHTITSADLANVPTTGTVIVGNVSHQQVHFQGRVLDLIGINQKLADYEIQ